MPVLILSLRIVLRMFFLCRWVEKVLPYTSSKTPEQLIVAECEAERADFLALDRSYGFHHGPLVTARATIVLLPNGA
jgi:hypothetical protein